MIIIVCSVVYLVFDGRCVEHSYIVYSDPLSDDPLAPPFKLLFTITVSQVKQPNSILRWKVNLVCIQIVKECSVHWIAKMPNIYTPLIGPLLPVILQHWLLI